MIGVVCKREERHVVEEFFELFKTPWEHHHAGRRYDVVVCTTDATGDIDAGLLIVYGSDHRRLDHAHGLSIQMRRTGQRVSCDGREVPVYGPLAYFASTAVQGCPSVVRIDTPEPFRRLIRVGYDLFDEVLYLLSTGQPPENAHIPALELHIDLLRRWIVGAGLSLVEVPPIPAGHDLVACLTHDIDFLRITDHGLNRTFWGFIYRALPGSFFKALRGRIPWSRFWRNVGAVASLPWVHLGLCRDFWLQFENYARIEQGLGATYFFIPFKNRVGDRVFLRKSDRRATCYDVQDARHWIAFLMDRGYEIGLHGIDAWHDTEKAQLERDAITKVTGTEEIGARMHWLCFDAHSARLLEDAGFTYDSTCGYNDTVGFRAGTAQVFRPPGARQILEVPLHIQDLALFSPIWLNLNEAQAEERCNAVVRHVQRFGGAVTILWHERSLAPERLWGDFYVKLIDELKARRTWFATAAHVAEWFRLRRAIAFKRPRHVENELDLRLDAVPQAPMPGFIVRTYRPASPGAAPDEVCADYSDVLWSAESRMRVPIQPPVETIAHGA